MAVNKESGSSQKKNVPGSIIGEKAGIQGSTKFLDIRPYRHSWWHNNTWFIIPYGNNWYGWNINYKLSGKFDEKKKFHFNIDINEEQEEVKEKVADLRHGIAEF